MGRFWDEYGDMIISAIGGLFVFSYYMIIVRGTGVELGIPSLKDMLIQFCNASC